MRVQLVIEAIDKASRVFRGVNNAMNAMASNEVASRVQVARANASNQLAAAQTNMVGSVATAAAVAAPIAKAVSQFNRYEDALTDVGLKSDLSGQKLAQLGERIRAQSRVLNTSSVDLFGGMNKLMEGGLDVSAAEGALAAVAKAAIATKTPINDLSQLTVAMINNGKIGAVEIGKALSVLAQSGKDGNAELNRMVPYLPRLTSQFATMGRTGIPAVADIGAAFQVVNGVVNNMEGSAAGIRDILEKIASDKAQKAFKDAGIDINKVMKEAKAAGRPLDAIIETIQKFTAGDLTKVGEIFGDVQARQAAVALLQNLEKFEEIRKRAMSADDVIGKDFATRIGLGVEQTRALNTAFSELWTTLGQALAPMSKAAAERLTKIVWVVEAWAKANPELVSTIATVATSVAGLMVALAGLGLFFAALKVGVLSLYTPLRILWWPIGVLISFFGGLWTAISAGVAAVGGWGAAFGILAARLSGALSWLVAPLAMAARGFVALGAAMLTTPVGWIIGAIALIAGGAYLVYQNWDRLGPWFSQLWASIGSGIRVAWDGIVSVVSGIGTRIGEALGTAWSAVSGVFDTIKNAFNGVIDWVGGWGGRVVDAFSGAFGKVTDFIGGVAGRIGNLLSPITSALGKVSDFVFGPSVASVAATAEQAAAAKAAIEAIAPAAQAAAVSATAVFANLSFHGHGVAMMQTLASGIRAGAAEAVAAARATVQQIRDHLPHSPAKVGPLSDLDRVQFGQTLAGAIRTGSPVAVAAVQALAASMAGAIPASAAAPTFVEPAPGLSRLASGPATGSAEALGSGGGPVTVSVTLNANIQSGNADDVIARLKEKSY